MKTQVMHQTDEKAIFLLKDFAFALLASIIFALSASIRIPLPFTPVPIAITPHVVLLMATLLGSRRAALAVICYLFQGMAGLPVFSGGGAGIAWLMGPTGGYLIGYLIAAYAHGKICETIEDKAGWKVFLSLSFGNFLIYFLGASYLSLFLGIKKALLLGVLPFIGGDILKLLLLQNGLKAFGYFSKKEPI